MPDHSILNLVGQIGLEATAGAGGSAGKILPNTKIGLAPEGDFTEFKGEGQKYVTSVQAGDEWAAGPSTAPASFTEVCYPLESIVKKTTPTSLGSGAYQRVYDSNPTGPDSTQTYVVEKGDGTLNFQWTYVYWNEWGITLDRKGATTDGAMQGQLTNILQAKTASPTTISNVLFVPKQIDLFYAPDMATLSSTPTQILRGFHFEFKIGSRYNPFFPMNSSLPSYGGVVENPGIDVNAKIKLGADVNWGGTWAATTAYTLGQIRKRLTGTGLLVFKATSAGTSAASEPTWPSTIGGTVVDGTVTWTAILPDLADPIGLGMMRAGTKLFLRAVATGPLIGGAIYHKFILDLCGVVRAPWGMDDQDALATGTWDLRVMNDATAGYPFRITTINTLATL